MRKNRTTQTDAVDRAVCFEKCALCLHTISSLESVCHFLFPVFLAFIVAIAIKRFFFVFLLGVCVWCKNIYIALLLVIFLFIYNK